MTLSQFLDRLDALGSDLAAWPVGERAAALRLVAADDRARAMHEQARRMDAVLRASVTEGAHDAARTEAAGARVVSRLEARPLPAQRRSIISRWWPDALLNYDFAPAWPRIAGLALAGCLGLAIGLFGITISPIDSSMQTATAGSFVEADLGALVSEPEPMTGARP
jgi:hypothetical protein